MMRSKIFGPWHALCLAACLGIASSSLADTQENCLAMWKEADQNGNGALTPDEDQRGYIAALSSTPSAGAVLSRDEFLNHCTNDAFAALAKANAPQDRGKGDITPGRTHLPEAEVRKRLAATGYREIGNLRLEAGGIWRGSVVVNGKPTTIAVDPQGDILTGN